MYTGGAEHSVLHLMYSRFVTMALSDWGYLEFEEPFPHFYAHGLVIKDGAKMSKSKGNVVTPDAYIKLYGADALRLYLMFMGPFGEGGDFRDSAMEGMARWVGRVWRIVQASDKATSNERIQKALEKLVKKLTEDIEKRRYNTAIASMMEFTNLVADEGGVLDDGSLGTFARLLAPFAPHLAEEIWSKLNTISKHAFSISKSIHSQPWPTYDPAKISEETTTVIIQVNGKLRDRIVISAQISAVKEEVEKLARKQEKVAKMIAEGGVKQVIFVPGRLINFVI